MAIQPIASPQARNLSALDSLLSRGGATFDTAISNAVQIGRDLANRQTQQERNFLTEQRRGINLDQRRVENERQDFEDDRTFDEGVRRFDLGFEESAQRFDLSRDDVVTGREFSAARQEDQQAFTLQRDQTAAAARVQELEADTTVDLANARADTIAAQTKSDEARSKRQKTQAAERLTGAREVESRILLQELSKRKQAGAPQEELERFYNEDFVGNPAFDPDTLSRAGASIGVRRQGTESTVRNPDVLERQKRVDVLEAQNIVAEMEAQMTAARNTNEEATESATLADADIRRLAKARAIIAADEEAQGGSAPSRKTPNPLDKFRTPDL